MADRESPPDWGVLDDPLLSQPLPLPSMTSALQDLVDPEFDPFDPVVAILDKEPRFLKPLPSRIVQEDLEFLRFRGALSIPESWLRHELLKCYVKWVHGSLPILHLQEFLRCVTDNDPNGNISILVFQAVMFVAAAFIDLKYLQAAGFTTRKSARSAFYSRFRLLYSLDCEDNRIEILQSILLTTYYSNYEDSPQRDMWDWAGICSTQALSIGLNWDPSAVPRMDVGTKRLRTRLWWCLYVRDRLIAMGLRRPIQVDEATCSVPMLRLEDFDFEPFSPSVLEVFHSCRLADVSHQKCVATIFIEKVKLSQCIGQVLLAQYMPSHRNFGTNSATATLVPRQASEAELVRYSQRLDYWTSRLPSSAQFLPVPQGTWNDGEDVILLYSAMLKMLYHAATSALHRPWAKANMTHTKPRLELVDTARARMHDAATGIAHVLHTLSQFDLARYLSQASVAVALSATIDEASVSPEPFATDFDPLAEFLGDHSLNQDYAGVDLDWTEELIGGTDFSAYTAVATDREQRSVARGNNVMDTTCNGITGDLDKDLGLGDEFC